MTRTILSVAVLLTGTATAQTDLPDLSSLAAAVEAGAPAGAAAGVRSGLDVPRVRPGDAAAQAARRVARAVDGDARAVADGLADRATDVLGAVEAQLADLGVAERDLGAAAAFAFVYLWQTARDEPFPRGAVLPVMRSVALAAGDEWGGRFRSLGPAGQERAYEATLVTTTLAATLAQGYDRLGEPGAEASVRRVAASAFAALFGAPPSRVRVSDSGSVSGLTPGAAEPPPSGVPAGSGPLAAPSVARGPEVYVLYGNRWDGATQGVAFTQELLVLFPDGTAVTGWPSGPVATFTADAVTAAFDPDDRPFYVGTWRRTGGRLTVTVDGETAAYVRESRGWRDAEEPDDGSILEVYFPAVPIASDRALRGPWETSSYFGGVSVGPAPSVSGGTEVDRVFFGDGRFADVERTTLATTRDNTLDLYNVYSDELFRQGTATRDGRWRLDGLVLTTEADGVRTVQPAFRLPHWDDGATSTDDVWIGADVWSRPE